MVSKFRRSGFRGSRVQLFWLLASGSWPITGYQQQAASDQQPVTSEPLNVEPLNPAIDTFICKKED